MLSACNHHASVRAVMKWRCDAEETKRAPENQFVIFSFVENPAMATMHASPSLCDRLTASGKSTVMIDYDVWGNSFDGLKGYKATKIDGQPFVDALQAHQGVDSLGPNPLAKPFENGR